MTPVRAVFAAVLAAVMLLAGTVIVARTAGREAADLFEILLAGPGRGIWCFLAAAGAVAIGAAGVLTAFLAFIEREEPDDGPFRRRGFPKSAPLLLIIASLALVWFALRCAAQPAPDAPIAVAVEPEAPSADNIEEALEGADPLADLDLQGESILYRETTFDWTFKDPLIRAGGPQWMTRDRPFTDESAAEVLCGMAWVAVTGSASEEGPADRNAERSRLRALAAAEAARRWIAGHPACGETFVFAVDLGQHAAGALDDTGAATAYQRRVLLMSRSRRAGEKPAIEAARAELAGWLADPASRARLLGGRRFPAEPVILPS